MPTTKMQRTGFGGAFYWAPIFVGFGGWIAIARASKPLGLAVLVLLPLGGAAAALLGDRALGWLVRLILGVQVLAGSTLALFWAATTLSPPYTPEGYAVMPTGQLAIAALGGILVAGLWGMTARRAGPEPGVREGGWLLLSGAAAALAAMLR